MPPASRTAAPIRRPTETRRINPAPLIGLLGAWFVVLIMWAGGRLERMGSVVFWLALGAAAVYAGGAIASIAVKGQPFVTTRKAAVVVLAVAVPVAFDPTTFDVFNLTKYTVVVWGSLVLGSLFIIEWVRSGRVPMWRNGMQWPVVALVGWTAICTIVSTNPRISLLGFYKSYDGLYGVIAFAVLFFAVTEALNINDVKATMSAFFVGGGGLAVLYGLIQLHDRTASGASNWDWVQWGDASFKGSSIWSTMGNPNHLAGFLVVAIPVGFVLFLVHRTWWMRTICSAIVVLAVLELIQTTTKGAVIGLAVAAFVMAIMFRPEIARRPWALPAVTFGVLALARIFTQLIGADRTRGSFGRLTLLFTLPYMIAFTVVIGVMALLIALGTRRGRPWMPLGIAFAAIAAVAVIGAVARPSYVYKAANAVFSLDGNSTGRQRLELWKSAIDMSSDKPFVGFGPDTYRVPFASYQSERFVELYGPDQIANGPHNTFMNHLAAEGVLGLVIFLALLTFASLRVAGAWRRLYAVESYGPARDRRAARDARFLLVGCCGAIVAYLGQASFNVQQIGLSFCFWLFLALIAVIALDIGVPNVLDPRAIVAGLEAPPPADSAHAGAADAEPIDDGAKEPFARSLSAAARKPPRRANTRQAPRQPPPPARSAGAKAPWTGHGTPKPRPSGAGDKGPVRGRNEARGRTSGLPVADARPNVRRMTASASTVSAVAIALAAFVIVVAWFASGPYRGDHHYRRALMEQNRAQVLSQSSQQQATEAIVTSRRKFDDAIKANPWEVTYLDGAAKLSFSLGQNSLQSREGRAPDKQSAIALFRQARAYFERAIKLQPRNPYLLADYARLMLSLQGVDSTVTDGKAIAVEALRRATAANPYQQQFPVALADQLSVTESIPVLTKALEQIPDSAVVLKALAKRYDSLGQKDKSAPLWERVLTLDPTDQEAATALGRPVTPTAPATPITPTAPVSPPG